MVGLKIQDIFRLFVRNMKNCIYVDQHWIMKSKFLEIFQVKLKHSGEIFEIWIIKIFALVFAFILSLFKMNVANSLQFDSERYILC